MQTVPWEAGVVNMVLADEIAPGNTDAERNSNNGDVYSVLKTCGEILRYYSQKHPDDVIYIKGADDRRERVYQQLLLREIKTGKGQFTILGTKNKKADRTVDDFELLVEGVNYVGFLVIPQN